jgi:hypothetical protein
MSYAWTNNNGQVEDAMSNPLDSLGYTVALGVVLTIILVLVVHAIR